MSAAPSAPSSNPQLAAPSNQLAAFWFQFSRWAPLVVPVVVVGIVLTIQPKDHFGPSGTVPVFFSVLYDDNDFAAYVQRGLSDRMGQVAGLPDNPDEDPAEFPVALKEDRPLKRLYFLEYPHTALFIFRLGYLFQPDLPPVPAVVLDSQFTNILLYRPQTNRERELWHCFRRAARVYICTMLACYFVLLAVLRSGYQRGGDLTSLGVPLILPATLFFTLYRFDIVPVLLCALSMWCLGRRWIAAAGVLLAIGAAVKVYPVLLVPLVLRYLWPDRRAAVLWAFAFGATLAGLLALPLLRFGWDSFAAPYRYQLGRKLWPGGTIYHALLPAVLGGDTSGARLFRLGSVLGMIGVLSLPRMPDLASLLRRAAAVLILFQSLLVFYSPQFILWLVPFLLPLTGRHRGLIWLVVSLDLLTWLLWLPVGMHFDMPESLMRARYLLMASMLGLLLCWDLAARKRVQPTIAPSLAPQKV